MLGRGPRIAHQLGGFWPGLMHQLGGFWPGLMHQLGADRGQLIHQLGARIASAGPFPVDRWARIPGRFNPPATPGSLGNWRGSRAIARRSCATRRGSRAAGRYVWGNPPGPRAGWFYEKLSRKKKTRRAMCRAGGVLVLGGPLLGRQAGNNCPHWEPLPIG